MNGTNAPRSAPEPVLLTETEAAAVLRLSTRSVRRLIAAGRLRVVHPVPGRTLITRRELDAYLAHLEGRRAA
jgi:excisionase family DNA binding protein